MKFFTQTEYEQRKIYFFKCKKCGKVRRQSLLKDRAERGVCGFCRRLVAPDGQLSFIGGQDA